MTALKPPIILFGNVRSGTTMTMRLFDAHPEVTGWFEPRTVWTYAAPRRRHDRFVAADATERVKRFVRGRFLRHQREHGNRRVMEKTPSNVMRVPYVDAIFPESRFLYILRDPLANLSSVDLRGKAGINRRRTLVRIRETAATQVPLYLARYVSDHVKVRVLGGRPQYYGVRYPGFHEDAARLDRHELIARQWVAASRQADADLAEIAPERVMRFRYEDFVADPVPHFDRMLEHFELPMTDELQKKLSEWVDPGRQKKWRRLDPEVLERCLPILDEEMRKQGYAPPDARADGEAS